MNDKFITCKDCPDRVAQPNCHSTCEGYIERQRKRREINEARYKQNAIDRGLYRSSKKWGK